MHSRIKGKLLGWVAGAAGAVAMIALTAATAAPPVRAVERLDATRYSGMWYEIARLPNSLQARCVGDVTASYRVLDDGTLALVHRCREEGEHWRVSVGRAERLPGDPSGARMRVSFLPDWLQWLPAAHEDHWVVLVDPAYRYAVVSEPSRQHLWILSREQSLDAETYEGIVAQLRAQRYPVDQLILTPHQPERVGPLATRRVKLLV